MTELNPGNAQRDGDPPPRPIAELEAVFAECRSGLRAFLAGKLPQAADVDDCLQCVSVAWLKNSKPIPRVAARAWLFRVAANEAALWWRKKATRDKLTDGIQKRSVQQHLETKRSDLDSPARASERAETSQRILAAIKGLPDESQTIIRMRIHEDLTFQQIADALQLPLGTVLSRMRRASQRLRETLADESPRDTH